MKKLILAIFALALVFGAPVAFACDGSCTVIADGGGGCSGC